MSRRPGYSNQRFTSRLLSSLDVLRESYWFVPMLMASVAAALALGLIELDSRIGSVEARRLPWIQDAGAEGTRAVLSAISSSMITVTGVVFSITIVALTLASSQFGPRLLRNFLRDRGNQLVLGTFVATFLYSLLVLRAVEAQRVPHIATAGAIALAIASVFVLIYFIHHASRSIQASSIIASVVCEIEAQLPDLFPETPASGRAPEAAAAPRRPEWEGEAPSGRAATGGYVRLVDTTHAVELAAEHDLVVELLRSPGDFVAKGAELVRAGPAERASEALVQELAECFVIGDDRSAVQDFAFLTEQLAEMAVRAMSPGINDPKTAIACVHRLGAVIGELAGREMPHAGLYDEEGTLRVLSPATSFGDVVASCLDSVQRYGGADAGVAEAALFALAEAVGACRDASRRELLEGCARDWAKGFEAAAPHSSRDRQRVDAAWQRFERALG